MSASFTHMTQFENALNMFLFFLKFVLQNGGHVIIKSFHIQENRV